MSGKAFPFKTITVFLLVVIALVMVHVEYRFRSPEWKIYQEKGIAMALAKLKTRLAEKQSADEKQVISSEMDSLKNRGLGIIEIQPFGGKLSPERCLTCHYGIEDLSSSHPNSVFGCVICHGGNGSDLSVRGAHIGLRGGRNPAKLDLAGAGCGGGYSNVGICHSGREHPLLNRTENVLKSLMATNAGIIGILRFQWGIEETSDSRYAVRAASDGKTGLNNLPPEIGSNGEFDLSLSHFRKFCASCHLWSPRVRENMGRLEGCPACHAPYGRDGRYVGEDPTVKRDEPGHASTHSITNRIPDDRCRACHNRSARIGLNYHGEMESEQYGTPFVNGGLNDNTISENRFVLKLVADIHCEKGMACIDCHTGQDTMGDGSVHRFMKDQVEIRCEDCHGSYSNPPRMIKLEKHDALAQTLIRGTPSLELRDGDTILTTSKGRPLPHVKLTAEGLRLTGKVDGKQHPVTVITGKNKAHNLKGHERLECDSCHSAWSPQCYGCHQVLDFQHRSDDNLSGKTTPGRWTEGRSFFRFEKNILGINSNGKVAVFVPGCQVWNTVIGRNGQVSTPYDSLIMRLKNGLTSVAMAPTRPHTSRKEVPRCTDCHLDSKSMGLGEGHLKLNSKLAKPQVQTLYDSAASGLKVSFALDAAVRSGENILQGTSHALARGFNAEEIGKIIGIARCLPCHDRYDDPVWQRPGPYKETESCLRALETMESTTSAQE